MTAYTLNGWTARPIPAGTVVPRTATTPRAIAAGEGFWGIFDPADQIVGFAEPEMARRLVDRVYSRRAA